MKKHILLIATGGTIASKNEGKGLAPAISSGELLSEVPEVRDICDVDAVQPFNLDSTDIYARHWLEMAALIEKNYNLYDGFVITHGTDTLAYTAAALSYLVQDSPKPIVFTGSQRSVCLRDTDARQNLLDAFCYCADGGAFGVNVVFDGKVILGTRAKKTRTRSYNAFASIDYPEIAIVREGVPCYYIKETKPVSPKFYRKLEERVFVLKMIPGLSAGIFDYCDAHTEGLIIESFGSGGLPRYGDDMFFTRLNRYLDMGKTAVLTTQVEREGSALGKYEVGRRLLARGNVLEARCMTLEAALTKLMWLLGNFPHSEIAPQFLRPVCKDIF